MNKKLKNLAIVLSVVVVLGSLQLVSADCLNNKLLCSNGNCLVECENGNCPIKNNTTKKKATKKKATKKKVTKKNTAKKKVTKKKLTKNSVKKDTKKQTKNKGTTKTSTVKPNTTVEQTTKSTNNTSQTKNSEENQYILKVVELVNKERTAAGLNAVTLDNTLKNAAMKRATEIVTSFSHTRPNGSSFSTVLSEYNISYRYCGENIAWGQATPQEVMNGWMNSAGHRANILNTNFKKLGVGYYKDTNGRKYWTQLFVS